MELTIAQPENEIKEKAIRRNKEIDILGEMLGLQPDSKALVTIFEMMSFNLHYLTFLTEGMFEGAKVSPTVIKKLMAIKKYGIFQLTRDYTPAKIIRTSKEIFDSSFHLFIDKPHEEFHVMYLNRRNAVLQTKQISFGGITGTVVDPKTIFHTALILKACSIILMHNHPSGNVHPSEQDNQLTKKLCFASKQLEIGVLDHIIFGQNCYYSYADEGQLYT